MSISSPSPIKGKPSELPVWGEPWSVRGRWAVTDLGLSRTGCAVSCSLCFRGDTESNDLIPVNEQLTVLTALLGNLLTPSQQSLVRAPGCAIKQHLKHFLVFFSYLPLQAPCL